MHLSSGFSEVFSELNAKSLSSFSTIQRRFSSHEKNRMHKKQ